MGSSAVPHVPIWLWLILAGVFIGIPGIVILLALLIRARAFRSVLQSAGLPAGHARVRASRVARWGLSGLGFGVLIGLALFADNRGELAVFGCAGGYLAGLLLGEYSAQPPVRGPVRAARLLARRPADYVPRWAVTATALTAATVLAAPVVFALAPTVRYGRWHPFGAGVTMPGGETSWPPVFPGTVAAAAFAVAVLGVGAAGLRRVAARPSPEGEAARAVDELLRRQAARAITGAVLGLELVMLAALLLAGSRGLAVPVADLAPGAYLGSRVMVIGGLCCAVACLAAWLVLSGWTRRGRSAAPPPGVPPGPAAVSPES